MSLRLATILFLFISNWLFANETKLEYSHKISISEGLPHNGVTSIIEDSRGFMWIGTYDGLCKYDGYECKIFKNTHEKKLLISNRVRSLWEDKKGNLWIGTDEGISIYDYSNEKFFNLYSNRFTRNDISGPMVRQILGNSNNKNIVCATEDGSILVFNTDYSFVKEYKPDFYKKPVNFISGIELDSTNYLFATTVGLLQFDLSSGLFKKQLKPQIENCRFIQQIDNHTLLVCLQFGISIIDYKINSNKEYEFVHRSTNLVDEQFNCSTTDSNGNLWLGTMTNGFVMVNDLKAILEQDKFDISYFTDKNELLRASAVFVTSKDECWSSTFNEGIYRFNTEKNPFKSYNISMDYPYGPLTNEVLHIYPMDEDRAFITANRGGISLFNTKTEKFEPLPFQFPTSRIQPGGPLFVDSNENIWMKPTSSLGFSIIRAGTTKLERVNTPDVNLINEAHIFVIEEDNNGDIWFGCDEDIIKVSFDRSQNITKIESLNSNPFFKDQEISKTRFIFPDPLYDYIWIGTNKDGLIRISTKEGEPIKQATINRYTTKDNVKGSISSNFVTSILRLPNNDMWIGTEGGGICKVLKSNTDSPYFIPFTEKQGLSNNTVKNILYDDTYNLWISTNIGLNKFSTKDNSFRKFTRANRIPFEDFNYASAKLKNGQMLFAGLDGLCYFNPFEVTETEKLPNLEIGSFKIFNEAIHPGDTIHKRVLLKKRLDDLDEITLKYNENVFSFEVTSLHYSTPENHHIRYQLLPLNMNWIEVTSDQKVIYYNGLQPGEYKLKVMASNSIGKWSDPKFLKIKIKPPFWKTTPAFLLYLFIIALTIYGIMHYMIRMNSLKYKLEIEQIEKNSIKEVNAAKLRFFSNISHEIKTPLTLISSPIKQMAERYIGNPELSDKLNLLQRQIRKIFQLVDQVHDFQRAEAYQLKMNYTNFYFDIFIQDLCKDFDYLARSEGKTLKITPHTHPIFVSADMDKLEKIVNNLLSNALKHTQKGDSISIEYHDDDRNLIVSVIDTGEGIDNSDLPYIFERFYRSQKAHKEISKGSGIGLAFTKRLVEMHYGYINAESQINQGSKFTIQLPVVTKETESELNVRNILEAEQKFNPKPLITDNTDLSSIKLEGEFSGSKIFFAEDNSDMRKFVSSNLSKFFKISTFSNGKECLNAMQAEWPDLVLSDVQMPVLNGFELCKYIKNDIKTSHIPVILLTACTTIEDQVEGIKGGADDYILKPFSLEHLVVRIESMLHSRKQLRERFQIDLPISFNNKKSTQNDNLFLEKLYNLMSENIDNQDLDLDSFARELYLNRTHFYQKVKAITNQTPFELLKMYRLKKQQNYCQMKAYR